jgi:methionyl-tRNA synthetase
MLPLFSEKPHIGTSRSISYEGILKEYILEKHKDDWKPNAYGQSKSWIDAGLQSRAMTRDLNWGIDVPLEQAKGKKLYVWFDAPIGYISATKALFAELESGQFALRLSPDQDTK